MGQIVPALDLRPTAEVPHPNDPDATPVMPSSLEAEQALLGALLYDNSALDLIEVDLDARHFYEPFHQRLYKSVSGAIRMGLLAEPAVLTEEFRRDPAFKDLGGVRYLADLVDRAPPAMHAPDYAATIFELANLRELIRIGQSMTGMAKGTLVDDETGARLRSGPIIEACERDLLQVHVHGRGRQGAELVDLADAAAGVLAYLDDTTALQGARTGLAPIDLQLGPLMPGDLILLAGRPSMGKSAVSLAASLNVAAPQLADFMNGMEYDGRPARGVIEFHGEMSVGKDTGGQVARRHLANIGFALYGKDFPTYKAIRDRNVSAAQREMLSQAVANFRGVPLRSVKRTGLKLSAMRAIARRQIAAWARLGIAPGLLVVDHVGLLRADGRVSGRYEAQTEIAIGAKELADELEIPVVALVQLSRDIEKRDDKRPQLSDLRDSGAWEENADIAAFVYRDAYYAQREAEPDAVKAPLDHANWHERKASPDIDVIFGKVREGEAGGIAKVWGALGWNAIRARRPDKEGGLL